MIITLAQIVGLVEADNASDTSKGVYTVPVYTSVKKPAALSHSDAAALLLDGVFAYSCMQYAHHITAGDSVLIIDA